MGRHSTSFCYEYDQSLTQPKTFLRSVFSARASKFTDSSRLLGKVARSVGIILLALVFSFAITDSAAAQDASIEGQVVDAETGESLPGATVVLEELDRATATDAEGFYRIENIPSGEYTLVANFVGYDELSQVVDLEPGEEKIVNFEMRADMLGLEEIVVTGVGTGQRAREVGTSVSRVDITDAEVGASLDEMLSGVAAGMNVQMGSGMTGSGTQIRLRGNVSATMSNQPLVYIDGMRTQNEGYPRNSPSPIFVGRSGDVTPNPLAEINPGDVERIEVVKGAAATTIYGSEASSGVIQIFTRQGADMDSPEITFRTEQGASWVQDFAPTHPNWADGVSNLGLDPFMRSIAHQQTYQASVRGGAEAVHYFVSGQFQDNDGIFLADGEQRQQIRGNVTFRPFENLNVRLNTTFSRHPFTNTPSGNNTHGITTNVVRRGGNVYGEYNVDRLMEILDDYHIGTTNSRFLTGLQFSLAATDRQSHRLTLGYDRAHSHMEQARPVGFTPLPEGSEFGNEWTREVWSAEYIGDFNLDLTDALGTTLSWGGQYNERYVYDLEGYGQGLPAPGQYTVSAAATTNVEEASQRVITGGVFTQGVIDVLDRYFMTVGFRVDGNSAFGEDLGLEVYPKANVSYVLSDEDFWPEDIGTLRLRAAVGQAGRAPGAFDAVRTWSPEGYAGTTAFRTDNLGNPLLAPERTTEYELGFEGSFFDERFSTNFTWYRQETTDALFAVTQIPSEGNWGSQLENVGELLNQGVEVQLDATVFQAGETSLEIGSGFSTNFSRVLDMGEASVFGVGGNNYVAEGQPLPAVRGNKLLNPDELAEPEIERNHYFGPNQPTYSISPHFRLNLPLGMRLSARGEFNGGHYMWVHPVGAMVDRGEGHPKFQEAYDLVPHGEFSSDHPNYDQLTARQRKAAYGANWETADFIYPADYFKLRDITLRVPLTAFTPEALLPGISTAEFSISGRNLLTWTNSGWKAGWDPEMDGRFGMGQMGRYVNNTVPVPSRITTSLLLTF